ncbi:response regulator [Salidesulfovibrio onnuriiensis]|uniref:response regulator n=1 Tax=Salidesulfovibrio onnuriiensis TaxID=2583823 RepID=UPI0011C936F8|nr:response regulator [Salidesulfovibrio onnuriiensis]
MRFLIVDDDESIHLYLQSILAPFAQCDNAMSGAEGVDFFVRAHSERRPYDVVFMDILMPEMDGHKAAELLRKEEIKLGIREVDQFHLVMITSLVDNRNVSKAFFNSFASCYIVKPFDKDKVLDELRTNMIL